MKWDSEWAAKKLDMPRRNLELRDYVDRWLPELKAMAPGLVVDIGCGPGDLLAMVRNYGHEVLGIDAPDGKGGMGDPYLEECRKIRRQLAVPVREVRLKDFLGWTMRFGDAACINCRGAVEQALSHGMDGAPHDEHHQCRLLDWHPVRGAMAIAELMGWAAAKLRPGGLLVIHANGTRSTDEWYDAQMRGVSEVLPMRLVEQEGLLLHKWVRA